ncbi:MAG: hypothetical protein VX899_19175 [Myxococcota bacterium]|nr:hypothetical protein [Myxococcota bacterium]
MSQQKAKKGDGPKREDAIPTGSARQHLIQALAELISEREAEDEHRRRLRDRMR